MIKNPKMLQQTIDTYMIGIQVNDYHKNRKLKARSYYLTIGVMKGDKPELVQKRMKFYTLGDIADKIQQILNKENIKKDYEI